MKQKTFHGMHVVPHCGKNRLPFNGFSGILIEDSGLGPNFIAITRVSSGKKGGVTNYIPYTETLDHSSSSGSAKADFLFKKAKEFAKPCEAIAITESIYSHLILLDSH